MNSYTITGKPWLDTLIIRGLLILATGWAVAIMTWLEDHGFKASDITILGMTVHGAQEYLAGAILGVLVVVATLVWNWLKSRADLVKAVQAGITLALNGCALDAAGKPITAIQAQPVAILPVTPASAKAIVASSGAK